MGRIKKYKMLPISKKFSEKGGFSAQFNGDGYSIDAVKDILPRIIAETGVKVGNGAAWDLVSSFIKACARHTSETGETVTVGSLLTFGLSIRGWYANQDSKADRDNVRVTATLLGDLKPTIEFSMSNDVDGVKLRVNTVRGATCALGHVRAGEAFQLNGIGLNLIEGDAVTAFATTPGGETVEGACTVTSAEEDRLDAILPAEFAVPSLVGRNVAITVTSHCGDASATPAEKTITATIDASTAPAPTPIAQTSDGKCRVLSFKDGDGAAEFTLGHPWKIGGSGLYGENAPEGEWALSQATAEVDGTTVEFTVTFSGDGTEATFGSHMFDPSAGTYENVALRYPVTRGGETETLTLTIPRLVVE